MITQGAKDGPMSIQELVVVTIQCWTGPTRRVGGKASALEDTGAMRRNRKKEGVFV